MHIRHLLFATVGVGILAAGGGAMAVDRCIGDCNHNGIVEIGELVRGVGIVLGRTTVTECAALDGNGDGIVHVAELVAAVSVHLNGGTALAQRFAARKYPLGTGAIDVVLADLNGDTVGDLVGALYAEKRIAIRLGRGDGRFGEAAYRTVGARTAPFRIASTDLNEDGRVDVATANGPAGSIAVMLGDGIGGLAPPAEIAVGAAVDLRSLAAGDIDGDDHVDLVAGDARSGDVIVMPGLGDGRFANATRIASGESQIQDVALSDVDRDGVLDVIAGSPASRSIVTLRGAGSGRFHPAVVSPAGGSVSRVRVADLDGDGSVDVLATSIFEGRLNVLIGDGKGGFSSRWGMTAGRDVAAAVGDVDHDGRPDIVASFSRPAAEGRGTVIGVFGGSDGIFEKQAEYLVGGPLRELLLADVNADGEVDVVGSNGMIVLHRTRGDGFDVPVALGGEVHGLAVGEIDGDACPDLVTTNGRTITSYRGRCDETFESHLHEIRDTNRSVLNGGGLLLGDVDGDGWNDVVAAGDQNDTISVLTNLGGGALSAPREYQGEMPWALAVGDFDEDGHPDLASDGGRILFGAADGSLRPGVPAVIPTGAGRVLSRDLDLDGHDDLAYGGWRLTAFYGLGDGTFQASANNPAGAHGDVAAGDVNVDGLLDLFIGDLSEVTGRVYVYLAQPGRRYAAATAYDTGGIGPTAVSAGDLTGDGVLDIVTANMGTNDFSVLVGRRDATFAPPQVFAAGTQPIAVALADVDPTELLMC